jgi:hypothetical protein
MKFLRLAVAAAFLLGFSSAYAFHSGGVAECGGCHAMHKADSVGNIIGAANANLLNNNHVSSTCFDCHSGATLSSYHVLTYPLPVSGASPVNRTPGGDFAWLAKTYSYTVRGSTTTWSPGGHHVNAPEYGINGETGNSPGGSFPANQLGCTSCHDPHSKARTDADGNLVPVAGNKIIGSGSYPTLNAPATGETNSAYGTYRLLYNENAYYGGAGAGPVPATIQSGVTFSVAPLAVAPSTYNQSENVNQVIVRYADLTGRTMGRWCASCHTQMHSALNGGKFVHPIDQALNTGGELGYYNAYVNSGNKNGVPGSSYLSLVPFAMQGATRAQLAAAATNSTPSGAGPGGSDSVMCLSCHRAHASGFQNDIRWEYEGEFLTYVQTGTNNATWPGTDTTPGAPQFARGRLAAETQAAYYDRPVSQFGAYQRSLCNKCHLQD